MGTIERLKEATDESVGPHLLYAHDAKQLLAVVEAAEAMVGPAIAILRTGQTTSPKAFTARTVRLRDALEPLQDALRAFQGQGESQ
jgi:hypothetical protein